MSDAVARRLKVDGPGTKGSDSTLPTPRFPVHTSADDLHTEVKRGSFHQLFSLCSVLNKTDYCPDGRSRESRA